MFEQSWIPSLPPLLGTDRQLDWAATERHKLLVLAEHALRIGRSLPEFPAAAVRDALDWLGSINDAGWWLDHRDLSGIDVALSRSVAWHPIDIPPATSARGPTQRGLADLPFPWASVAIARICAGRGRVLPPTMTTL